MRRLMLVLLLGAVVGCGVSEKAAQDTLAGVESIATAPADVRMTLLLSMCVESPACVGDCKEVLQSMGSASPETRMLLISHCDSSVKPLPETDGRKAFAEWTTKRVDAYLKKVRDKLPEADRGRLDKAWATAQQFD